MATRWSFSLAQPVVVSMEWQGILESEVTTLPFITKNISRVFPQASNHNQAAESMGGESFPHHPSSSAETDPIAAMFRDFVSSEDNHNNNECGEVFFV